MNCEIGDKGYFYAEVVGDDTPYIGLLLFGLRGELRECRP
jgi:hypothetical protein